MLNLLNTSVGDYLKENIVLTVVLALILAIIAVLCVIMIVLHVKAKKTGANEEIAIEENTSAPEEEQSVESPAEEKSEELVAETPQEPVAEEPVAETPQESVTEEPATEEPNEKTEEPVAEESAEKQPAEESEDDDKAVGFKSGKWIIRKTEEGKFTFTLYAANGSTMLESGKEYSSLSTAKQGIETYKKNFAGDNCKVVSTKPEQFVYKLTNANGMLLAVSANYTSKSSCESALESAKNYAINAPVEVVKN